MKGGVGIILRRLRGSGATCTAAARYSIGENLIFSSAATYSTLILTDEIMTRPIFSSAVGPRNAPHFQSAIQIHRRSFSSTPSSSDPSNIVLIETEKQFDDSLRKVQDEALPAIFYFTAVWCGPCRLLSPVIEKLSEQYPHVTTYKIDIDKEELGKALSKLSIHSVPTLHFFQNGKKASEVVGADVQRLKDTMESLYK